LAKLERKDQGNDRSPARAPLSNDHRSHADETRAAQQAIGRQTMEFFGRLFGLTATIISALILLVIVALLANSGQLDEAAGAFVQILLIPVQVVGVFVDIVQAAVEGGIFVGGGGA
jgi:hypothetical protein